jgi:hypothetical protein
MGGQIRQQRHADVRRACARRDNWCWKLLKIVGGSQFSCSVTNVSKYRQVRRPAFSRKTRCQSDKRMDGGAIGRLRSHPTIGEMSQSESNGHLSSGAGR